MRWFVDGIARTWLLVVLALLIAGPAGFAQENIGQIPAPEERSNDYTVQVEGRDIPVYAVKVAPADPARRWKAMDDKVRSAEYFDRAAFAYFDMRGPVAVTVTCPEPITSAKVLPSSFEIVPVVEGRRLTFSLTEPQPVTIEVNGNWVGALHLFANPPEAPAPRPDDPNVIYFGPGVHEVAGLTVGSGKTVYVAAGAVVKGTGDRRGPVFTLKGEHIVLRGRGVIDGSLCPTHSRNLLLVCGKDITVEGVIFRGVTFKDILAVADPLRVELKGFDETHAIDDVAFQGVRANGRPLTQADVKANAFVRDVRVSP